MQQTQGALNFNQLSQQQSHIMNFGTVLQSNTFTQEMINDTQKFQQVMDSYKKIVQSNTQNKQPSKTKNNTEITWYQCCISNYGLLSDKQKEEFDQVVRDYGSNIHKKFITDLEKLKQTIRHQQFEVKQYKSDENEIFAWFYQQYLKYEKQVNQMQKDSNDKSNPPLDQFKFLKLHELIQQNASQIKDRNKLWQEKFNQLYTFLEKYTKDGLSTKKDGGQEGYNQYQWLQCQIRMAPRLSKQQNDLIDNLMKKYNIEFGQEKKKEMEKFQSDLKELKQWLDTHDKIPTKEQNPTLCQWIKSNDSRYLTKEINPKNKNEKQVQYLELRNNYANKFDKSKEDYWMEKYQELVQYCEQKQQNPLKIMPKTLKEWYVQQDETKLNENQKQCLSEVMNKYEQQLDNKQLLANCYYQVVTEIQNNKKLPVPQRNKEYKYMLDQLSSKIKDSKTLDDMIVNINFLLQFKFLIDKQYTQLQQLELVHDQTKQQELQETKSNIQDKPTNSKSKDQQMKPISTMANTTPIMNRGLNDGNWHRQDDSVSEYTTDEPHNLDCE